MRRSESWPQIFVLPVEKEHSGECQLGTQCNSDFSTNKEADYEQLTCQVANYEVHCNELTERVEQIEMENEYLNKEIASLKEENIASTERVKFLEHECDQERLRVKELECVIADLQKDYEEVENDKRNVSKELSTQKTRVMALQSSKKNLEGQVQQLQESTEWRQMEQNRIRDLVQETNLLKSQLQDMEQQLQTMEKHARDATLLEKENHEMQVQISEMVQQNIKQKRQLDKLIQNKDYLEQHNHELQEEMQTLKMEGSCSRESSSPHIHRTLQEQGVVEEEGEEAVEGEGDHTFDYTCNGDDNEVRMQILSTESHLARTPPALSLADEVRFSIYGAHAEFEDMPVQPTAKSSDALEEYIHLTAAAVKIRFHMVPISSEKLIKRVHGYPFYRMHDELTKYMEEKLNEQQSLLEKPEQNVHQQQDLVCMRKEQDEQNPATKMNKQPSVFNKVRNLFRPKATSG